LASGLCLVPRSSPVPPPERDAVPSVADGAAAVPKAKNVKLAKGETLTSVAKTAGLTASVLAAANGLANPDTVTEGTDLWIPDVHVIASGETLTAIAKKLGVSVADILACNNIPNPDKIYAGDGLVIPSK